MAKSFKTVYFSSDIMLEAERQKIDINAICNEALRLAVTRDANQGTEPGNVANYIDREAQKQKNIKIMQKLALVRDEKFNKNMRLFCEEYGYTLAEGLKIIGG